MKYLKFIFGGLLLGIAFTAIAGLNLIGIPVELVPMVGGSLYVGSQTITRVKG